MCRGKVKLHTFTGPGDNQQFHSFPQSSDGLVKCMLGNKVDELWVFLWWKSLVWDVQSINHWSIHSRFIRGSAETLHCCGSRSFLLNNIIKSADDKQLYNKISFYKATCWSGGRRTDASHRPETNTQTETDSDGRKLSIGEAEMIQRTRPTPDGRLWLFDVMCLESSCCRCSVSGYRETE